MSVKQKESEKPKEVIFKHRFSRPTTEEQKDLRGQRTKHSGFLRMWHKYGANLQT